LAFLEYVRSGNGLVVIHSGAAGYQDFPGLRGLMGGAFASHPPQCPVTVLPRPGHLLSVGSEPFTLVDEHYVMSLDDSQADVFLTSTSAHGQQPGGWTRFEGAGRVCVLTPGHTVAVWLHPAYQALMRNALCWCSKLPAEAACHSS
jgi:type 1 glutamine amidotransferase